MDLSLQDLVNELDFLDSIEKSVNRETLQTPRLDTEYFEPPTPKMFFEAKSPVFLKKPVVDFDENEPDVLETEFESKLKLESAETKPETAKLEVVKKPELETVKPEPVKKLGAETANLLVNESAKNKPESVVSAKNETLKSKLMSVKKPVAKTVKCEVVKKPEPVKKNKLGAKNANLLVSAKNESKTLKPESAVSAKNETLKPESVVSAKNVKLESAKFLKPGPAFEFKKPEQPVSKSIKLNRNSNLDFFRPTTPFPIFEKKIVNKRPAAANWLNGYKIPKKIKVEPLSPPAAVTVELVNEKLVDTWSNIFEISKEIKSEPLSPPRVEATEIAIEKPVETNVSKILKTIKVKPVSPLPPSPTTSTTTITTTTAAAAAAATVSNTPTIVSTTIANVEFSEKEHRIYKLLSRPKIYDPEAVILAPEMEDYKYIYDMDDQSYREFLKTNETVKAKKWVGNATAAICSGSIPGPFFCDVLFTNVGKMLNCYL